MIFKFLINFRENSRYIDQHLSPAKEWEKIVFKFYSYVFVVYVAFQLFSNETPSPVMHYFIYGTFCNSVALLSQATRHSKEIWNLRNTLPHLGPSEQSFTVFIKNGWPVFKGTMGIFGGTATVNYVYGEVFGFTPLTEWQYSMRGYQSWDQAKHHLTHPWEYDSKSEFCPWQQDLLKENQIKNEALKQAQKELNLNRKEILELKKCLEQIKNSK